LLVVPRFATAGDIAADPLDPGIGCPERGYRPAVAIFKPSWK